MNSHKVVWKNVLNIVKTDINHFLSVLIRNEYMKVSDFMFCDASYSYATGWLTTCARYCSIDKFHRYLNFQYNWWLFECQEMIHKYKTHFFLSFQWIFSQTLNSLTLILWLRLWRHGTKIACSTLWQNNETKILWLVSLF